MTERQIKDLNYIKDRVEFYTGLDIRKKTREREYVYTRMIFCKIMREEFLMTMSAIGEYLGKSHCTIVHYMKNFDTIKNYEHNYFKVYNYIQLEMNAEHLFIGTNFMGKKRDISEDILEFNDKIQKVIRTAVKKSLKEYKGITKKALKDYEAVTSEV